MSTLARLSQVLHFEPELGSFFWRVARSNRVRVGERAGFPTANGYWGVRIDGVLYYEHHLSWLFSRGEWPPRDVDHVFGDKLDNRPWFLRDATESENAANSKRSAANTSGHKGVSWNKRLGRWHAYIMKDRRRIHLGFFDDIDRAAEAYRRAASQHFGQFARSQ